MEVKMNKRSILFFLLIVLMISCRTKEEYQAQDMTVTEPAWIALLNGKNLDGWFVQGEAKWEVRDSILTGIDGMGHIYADPVVKELEVKGKFIPVGYGNPVHPLQRLIN
jgi:hypothetical protein